MRDCVGVFWLMVMGLGLAGCGEDSDEAPAPTPEPALDAGMDANPEPDAPEPDAAVVDAEPDAEPMFSDDPAEWPVDAPGPFNTGWRVVPLTYSSPDTGEPRTIGMNVWYPTEATEGAPARYLDLGAFADAQVFTDAPLAPPVHDGQYPVYAYSHGSQGFGGTASATMRHFASHGWVTVAPDHTGNTISMDLSPRPISMYFHRPLDMTAVLDALEALSDDDPLAGKLNMSRIVLGGHSFGAFTTWGVAGATFDVERIQSRCDEGALPSCTEEEMAVFAGGLRDGRVVATVPMAGSLSQDWFGETGHTSVQGPVLFMSGSEDDVGAEGQFERVEGLDFTWIDLDGGCHETFALGFCGSLLPDEGFAIVNTYIMAFARIHTLQDPNPALTDIVDGTTEVSPKVTLRQR